MRVALAIVCLLLVVDRRATASEGPPPVLNPRTYVSPSGAWRLLVDPNTMYGQGAGNYRLTQHDKVVWEGERDFTLWEAGVTDDGIVAGYAYSHGWRGFPPEAARDKVKRSDWNGDFRVLIIDPAGKSRLDERQKRAHSQFMHSPPQPLASGMFIDGENDRFVLRMADSDQNDRISTWRVYRMSDGKRLGDLQPRKHLSGVGHFCDDFAARPVRGTPLTLVHWWLFDEKPSGKFTLLDGAGRPVWTRDLPDDYAIPGDQPAEWRLRDAISETGAILRCDEPRRFELWHVRDRQRVTYEVRERAGKWDVVEVARSAYAREEPRPPVLEKVTLKPLGSLRLGEQRSLLPAIRDVHQFSFDANGNVGFVRRDTERGAVFVLAAADGSPAKELALGTRGEPNRGEWLTAWLSGARWIVLGLGYGINPPHRAYHVEPAAEKVTELGSFDCPASIRKLAGDNRGGFVVLVSGEFDKDGVIAFDGEGRRRWRVGRVHSGAGILMFPEDLAVTSDGNAAVVCSFNKLVQLYDANGRHVRRIELKRPFTREPEYPSEIGADRDGGLIVGDWQGSPPVWRITTNGKLVSTLEPKYADGRSFSMHYGVRASPDGRLWTTDGSSLLRLNEAGVVDQVLGEAPQANQLGDVSEMFVDRHGNFYLVSTRTTAVHVFDSAGKLLRVCTPLPSDFSTNAHQVQVGVAADGEVFVWAESSGGKFLRFGADGRRIGFVSESDAGPGDGWAFRPVGRERWASGYEAFYLVGGDGKTRRTIERRPDRNWLERPGRIAAAHDGGVVVVSTESRDFGKNPMLNAYTPAGDPLATIPLPCDGYTYSLTTNGTHAVCFHEKKWLLIDIAARIVREFSPELPACPSSSWRGFFSPDGAELWMCEPNCRVVQRFALPKGG